MTDADNSISLLLSRGASESNAIGAPDCTPLTYRALRDLAARTVEDLNGIGIGRGDRVAFVLANGPELAAAFVCIAAGAAAAPLNPGYHAEEFEFYLGDLRPKALVVEAGVASPARSVAARLNIPVVELRPDRSVGGGGARLEPPAGLRGAPRSPGAAQAEDVALLLHTSGTTSRPKLVPLTQANISASARNIGATLALTPADVCLNIMPLFHVHGLMAGVLASLAAGGQVCCTPGFNALRFFHWLEEVHPTWTTGVPTMHRAILGRAERNPEILARRRLRFIRSSSAQLRPRLMGQLEQTFQAPVIESYGMTEASHQMASNPLPPRERKAGSVGVAAGPDVAIMDEAGNLLGAGRTGEVVIRGPNVTQGYENNPAANQSAFTKGWF